MRPTLREMAETGVIFLGILTLWPWILGHRSWQYTAAAVLVLILLGALALRRWRRVKQALSGTVPGAQPGPNNTHSSRN